MLTDHQRECLGYAIETIRLANRTIDHARTIYSDEFRSELLSRIYTTSEFDRAFRADIERYLSKPMSFFNFENEKTEALETEGVA